MTFEEALPHTIELLERQGWASYRLRRRRFRLDEVALNALITELVVIRELAQEAEDGDRLVWKGELRPRATSAWQAMNKRATAPAVLPPSDEVDIPAPPHRRLTSLVGREFEVSLLLERWARVEAGQGQVVWLRGEAGIGKSRLVRHLQAHIANRSARIWACRCAPKAQLSAFSPLINLLQQEFGDVPEDPPEARLRKLEAGLLRDGVALPKVALILANLLSVPLGDGDRSLTLPPDQQRAHMMATMVEIVGTIAQTQPMLLIVEDLHWSDASTLEWLERLVGQTERLGVYVLLTSRPEFQASWLEFAYLPLSRLNRYQVEVLVTEIADGKRLPAEVVKQIEARTEGVPLFVEEVTQMVLDSDLLQASTAGYELTGPVSMLAVPATLNEAMQPRLLGLGASARQVVQMASAWGRGITENQLLSVVEMERRQLPPVMEQLVKAGLTQELSLPPQVTYVFKHALIQDAVYGSMAEAMRREAHHRIAQVLASDHGEIATRQPEVVAHHYTEAEQYELAVTYWLRAGDRAQLSGASTEAIEHLRTSQELLQGLAETPERAIQAATTQLRLGAAFGTLKSVVAPETENAYQQARVLSERVGDSHLLARSLTGLTWSYSGRGDMRTAYELAAKAFDEAQHVGSATHLLIQHRMLGYTLFHLGDFDGAREHTAQAMALRDLEPHAPREDQLRNFLDASIMCQIYNANALWALGYPDQARQQSDAAIALAREVNLPTRAADHMLVRALCQSVFYVLLEQGDLETAAQQAEEHITLSLEHELEHHLLQQGRLNRAIVQFRQGEMVESTTFIRQFPVIWRSLGWGIAIPQFLAYQGEVASQQGEIDVGLSALQEGLRVVQQTDERQYEAELYRLRGELLRIQRPGDEMEAERQYHQALRVARHQRAKSFELRAATSLAQLWQAQHKRRQAYDLLASVYDGFREGFDTKDLQAGKALLESLAG